MGFSRQEYWSGVPLPSPCGPEAPLYEMKRGDWLPLQCPGSTRLLCALPCMGGGAAGGTVAKEVCADEL